MWIIYGLYAGYMWSIYGVSPKQVRHCYITATVREDEIWLLFRKLFLVIIENNE
jgi:hypothetical protein